MGIWDIDYLRKLVYSKAFWQQAEWKQGQTSYLMWDILSSADGFTLL